jgi:hypothetical protein
MSKWVLVCCVALFALPSLAPAQVIYQPVQYQYGSREKFYYGGREPAIIAAASTFDQYRAAYERSTRAYNEYGRLAQSPLYVYSDVLPYNDAGLFGYTAMDAMNDAYANVPRYFRKADLLQSAERQPDGTLTISSRVEPGRVGPGYLPAGSIDIHPYKRTTGGPILIIPKRLLDKPSDNWLASAR